MELAVITTSEFFEKENEIIIQLFENGLQRLHLRKPDADLAAIEILLQQIPTSFHSKIILHQHPQMLDEYGVGGFHINRHHFENRKKIQQKIKPAQSFSISTHAFDEIKNDTIFDYYFISPIFDSISKHGYHAAFDKQEIELGLKENSGKKIFALGGVNAVNIAALKKMGFSGAAVLGVIWECHHPIKSFIEIQQKIEDVK